MHAEAGTPSSPPPPVPRGDADRARAARAPGTRAMVAAAGLATLAFVAVAAPWIVGADPLAVHLASGLCPPSWNHPFGCDRLGRDVLARTLAGARVSLLVASSALLASATLGTAVGAWAGLAGGRAERTLMRIVDVLVSFPGLLLAIALAGTLGPGTGNVVLALSALGWTSWARLVRGEVRAIARREHVEAAVALGVGRGALLGRHVLPLLAAPLAVQASFGAAAAVTGEAALSFLGVGVQPPSPSWGSMLAEARSFVVEAPHLLLAPGAALALFVALLHALGDALAERVDARRASQRWQRGQ